MKIWKQTAREMAVIILVACVAGTVLNLALPGGYVFVSKETVSYRKISMISAEEARLKYDGRTALFIDAREPVEYEQGRIPGAVNIPAEPESISLQGIKANFDLLQGPRELVIYCSARSCESSETLARRFIHMGYSKTLYIIEGGLPAWHERNFPLEIARERRGD
jgi:rhodanese-related sulfurtransferase